MNQPEPNDEPIQGQVVPEGGDPLADLLGGGGFDLGSVLEMASTMQQQMAEAQEQLLHPTSRGLPAAAWSGSRSTVTCTSLGCGSAPTRSTPTTPPCSRT